MFLIPNAQSPTSSSSSMTGRLTSALTLQFDRMPAIGNRKCNLAECKRCDKTFAWGVQGFHRHANNDNCPGVRQTSLAFSLLLFADLINLLPVFEGFGIAACRAHIAPVCVGRGRRADRGQTQQAPCAVVEDAHVVHCASLV